MTGGDTQYGGDGAAVAVVTVAYRSNDVLPGFLESIGAASARR